MRCVRDLSFTVSVVWVAFVLVVDRPAKGDYRFGEPRNVGAGVNSASDEISPSISAEGLTLYFASNRSGGSGDYDLWVSMRPKMDAAWGPAVNLGPSVNSHYSEVDPSISSDGLSLYFSDPYSGLGLGTARPGPFPADDLGYVWVITRATVDDPWSTPVNLGRTLFGGGDTQVVQPSISADGLSLFMIVRLFGIGVASRASTAESFGRAQMLSFFGGGPPALWPNVSADGRVLFFASIPGSFSPSELWMRTRSSPDSLFGAAVKLPAQINVLGADVIRPYVSPDGSTLYFSSTQAGGQGGRDIWEAPILPIADFNGDGKVDIQDLVRLIQSWGKVDPVTDIGPMPWGDGKVDEKDLEVLMGYWGQEVNDPTLIAHWKLDETEGTAAVDSAGAHDGTLSGHPVWQPMSGKRAGALLLDGIGDCVTTPFVRNPSTGPFSVLTWVKGGAPGQVILSQADDANWLLAASPKGTLTTELTSGRGGPLGSPAIITDGAWHRVGLVRDGPDRILYVDGVEVARDVVVSLAASGGGLHIGAGAKLGAGAFWSGLIDDIRIYDRAVKP
jgi:hypothetical protein